MQKYLIIDVSAEDSPLRALDDGDVSSPVNTDDDDLGTLDNHSIFFDQLEPSSLRLLRDACTARLKELDLEPESPKAEPTATLRHPLLPPEPAPPSSGASSLGVERYTADDLRVIALHNLVRIASGDDRNQPVNASLRLEIINLLLDRDTAAKLATIPPGLVEKK